MGKKKGGTVAKIAQEFKASTDNQHLSTQRLVVSNNVTTTVGGIINNTFPMNPSGTSEWSTFATIYDEFRVLAVRITLVSLQQFSVTNANAMLFVVFDNDDSNALGSNTAALSYDTCRVASAVMTHSGGRPFSAMWARPTAGKNTAIPWVDIGSPAGSIGSIKLFSSGLAASVGYLQYSIEYFTEYRGRR